MRKKLGQKTLVLLMVLLFSGSMIGNAYAASNSVRASYYLDYYFVDVDNGTGSKVEIWFEVDATRVMDLVGLSYLIVQENDNGTWKTVATCFGSTSNGLLAADTDSHVSSISYTGTSGKEYRAIATVYAENSSGSDYRTVTTSSITA